MPGNAIIRVNSTRLRLALRNFTKAIAPAPLLRIVAEVMRTSIQRTFREQGPGWPPLATSTQERLGARAGGHKLLVMSGRLKNSITYAIINGNRLLIGTNLVYALIHQLGGYAGRKTHTVGKKVAPGPVRRPYIPARPYLVFRPEDPDRMRVALDRYIAIQASKAGL